MWRKLSAGHSRWVAYEPGRDGDRARFMADCDAAGYGPDQCALGSFHIMGGASASSACDPTGQTWDVHDLVVLPEPFAVLIYELLEHRPNLQTAGADTMYLFPGYRSGRHLHPQTVMHELRRLGINLLGSRNSALRNLVQLAPAPSSPTCSGIAIK